jgi:poly(A) polymerase
MYQLGADLWRDRVLVDWAKEIATGTPQDRHITDVWRALYNFPDEWTPPAFLLQGNDVLALGVEAGPAVGDYLKEVEEWWIAGGFAADREACLAKLNELTPGK